ncbi:glycosyltransferase family 39 protein [Noviherbaspirillum suwonense]|jgi:4-amino-4-deoxy-L-arabinose transferase-like glycosyltransferase|uniref:4-amino-4-deoxy-L-arabinose transferase n=1 Tax=Noviherbaspirillum suwonense TaxID=1224511 RepID=A0ABY1QH72_9BURK|nr:glycosyltransferase family 39 protein [Noviherbaspirillum suwonense]SMP70552.1 4-amino-4-deoxy-L-arabinose transferase [Noviherbaspirillum suwonense]
MNQLHRSRPLVIFLLVAFCAVWFYALSARTLVPTDEGRYAEMGREMVVTNDWITPRLNGIKYFEKPPLQTWMNAATFKAFGFGEWQARLWTGLCGLLGIALVALAGRRLYGGAVAFSAATVLASSFLWAALGHVNTLDMGLAGMMTVSLCSLLIAQRNDAAPAERRNWMLACWAGMALAVLSKGLIGIVLPGAVLVLYTVLARDWAIWRRLHLLAGLLLFFAITVPWFVLVSLRNPEFAWFFFVHEHLQRFTSNVHHRAGPLFYFVPILALGLMPWLGTLPQAMWNARRDSAAGFQPKILLGTWAVFIFVFFSVSGSKLPSYILPIFPALALLIGCHLQQAGRRSVMISAGMLALFAAVGLALLPKVAAMASNAFEAPLYREYGWWVGVTAALTLVGSLAAMWQARRSVQAGMLLLAITGFMSGQMLMLGHEPMGRYAAGVGHLPALEAELTPQTPLYIVGRYEQSLPFYLGRTMTMVQHADELEFGLQQQPELWLPTREAFMQVWLRNHASGTATVAILSRDAYDQFVRAGLPMRVIGDDPRRVIVSSLLKPPSRTST